jgi:hypothetical protein
MLGHGNKSSVNKPKLVETLMMLETLQISCGAYHTAFIAGVGDELQHVMIPRVSHSPSTSNSSLSPVEKWRQLEAEEDAGADSFLSCGILFTCGLGSAGQLGHASSKQFETRPTPGIVVIPPRIIGNHPT